MKIKHKCKECAELSKFYAERSKKCAEWSKECDKWSKGHAENSKFYAELSKFYAERSKKYAKRSKWYADKCQCKEKIEKFNIFIDFSFMVLDMFMRCVILIVVLYVLGTSVSDSQVIKIIGIVSIFWILQPILKIKKYFKGERKMIKDNGR